MPQLQQISTFYSHFAIKNAWPEHVAREYAAESKQWAMSMPIKFSTFCLVLFLLPFFSFVFSPDRTNNIKTNQPQTNVCNHTQHGQHSNSIQKTTSNTIKWNKCDLFLRASILFVLEIFLDAIQCRNVAGWFGMNVWNKSHWALNAITNKYYMYTTKQAQQQHRDVDILPFLTEIRILIASHLIPFNIYKNSKTYLTICWNYIKTVLMWRFFIGIFPTVVEFHRSARVSRCSWMNPIEIRAL